MMRAKRSGRGRGGEGGLRRPLMATSFVMSRGWTGVIRYAEAIDVEGKGCGGSRQPGWERGESESMKW